MAKPKRHVLSLESDIDFELIGICSHHSDYRLAWSINRLLGINLVKSEEPFSVYGKKGVLQSNHSYYIFIDENDHLEWYLIKNKSEGKFLIPEKNQIDYFLILREYADYNSDDVLAKVKESNSIMAAYIFEASGIPSAGLIQFE